MKKYKLIKEYPGSPELNTIVRRWTKKENSSKILYGTDNSLSPALEPTIIENYPEFWEEVREKILIFISEEGINVYEGEKYFAICPDTFEIVESIADYNSRESDWYKFALKYNAENYVNQNKKEYKILSFKGTRGIYLRNGNKDIWELNDVPQIDRTEKHYLNNPNTYQVYSVKRLSDGEVFTIGDKITGKSQYNCIINSIELNPNCNQIMFNRLDEGIDLINAKHIKQPLFTTEDGIDIFESSDIFYYVKFTQYNMTIGKPFEIVRGTHPTFKYEPQYEKYFSTKEAAEEYIIMNKPCLSVNDVEHWIKKHRTLDENSIAIVDLIKKLKKIVESKLSDF